ncbi:hypothetical protein FRC04_009953 [Tulasnella sp. 424]|nr:hypothetical protein FRC04_009953 [Tulasnella sp. 424]KAG8971512.1 hypothetical protein FRC05_010989 [Tulasnella sp. 425]
MPYLPAPTNATSTLIKTTIETSTTIRTSSGAAVIDDKSVTVYSTDQDERAKRQHPGQVDCPSKFNECVTSSTTESTKSLSRTSNPASASPLRAYAILGTLDVPQPSPTDTTHNPHKTGIILGSLSIAVVVIATIISVAYYFKSLRKKCSGGGGSRHWRHSHRGSTKVDLDPDPVPLTDEDVTSAGAGGRSVVGQAPQSPHLVNGEGAAGGPTLVRIDARDSVPGAVRGGVAGQGPPTVAGSEGFNPYLYVAPPQGRSQTALHVQNVAEPADPPPRRSPDYGQQGVVLEVFPTVWPNPNQRQPSRLSSTSSFVRTPSPLRQSFAGGTAPADPTHTSSPSPNLSYQSYSPAVTPAERDQARNDTGTANSSYFDVRTSGTAAQPAGGPASDATRRPDSALSVLPTSPTSPGQRRPRPLPNIPVTGSGSPQPARNHADSPRALPWTPASEPSTTRPTTARGRPSSSNQIPPSYSDVATSQSRGTASSNEVGGLEEQFFVTQH